MAINVAAMALQFILLAIYRIICKRENARRDAMGATSHQDHAFEVGSIYFLSSFLTLNLFGRT